MGLEGGEKRKRIPLVVVYRDRIALIDTLREEA